MALPELIPVDPRGISFVQWASLLCEALAEYNVPNPVSEDSWNIWVDQLAAIPELAELGVPDGRAFKVWQDWAANISQVLWR